MNLINSFKTIEIVKSRKFYLGMVFCLLQIFSNAQVDKYILKSASSRGPNFPAISPFNTNFTIEENHILNSSTNNFSINDPIASNVVIQEAFTEVELLLDYTSLINPNALPIVSANTVVPINVIYDIELLEMEEYNHSGLYSLQSKNFATSYTKSIFHEELNIEYSNEAGLQIKDRAFIRYDNVAAAKVTIQSVVVDGAVIYNSGNGGITPQGYFPDWLEFKVNTYSERYKILPNFEDQKITANLNDVALSSNSNGHYLWWQDNLAMAHFGKYHFLKGYEVEMSRIDICEVKDCFTGIPSNFSNWNAVNYSFRNNATRVLINSDQGVQNQLYLPDFYDEAIVVWRVRPIGFKQILPVGGTLADAKYINITGKWNTAGNTEINQGSLSSTWNNKVCKYIKTNNVSNQTYQASISFAEGGKNKQVVTYFDKTFHDRQSITRLSSEDQIILVSDKVYDFLGRPAIQVLPAPVSDNDMYYRDLLKNTQNNITYSYSAFDYDWGSNCSTSKTIQMQGGAADYYSSNNTNNLTTDPYRDRIPNAFGNPFAQTEYMPDNTGRIRRQGGVGKNHQLKGVGRLNIPYTNTHQTEYLYSKPTPTELYSLFGYQAGLAMHHEKNIIIDPNGQRSISIVDASGRTIATALDGENTPYTEPLANMPDHSDIINLLEEPKQDEKFNNESIYETVETFTVSKLENRTLEYKIEINPYNEECNQNGSEISFCYDCQFDLYISVVEECSGNEVISGGPIEISAINADPLISQCSNPDLKIVLVNKTGGNKMVLNNLQAGKYKILKRLVLSEKQAEIAADHYVENFLGSFDEFGNYIQPLCDSRNLETEFLNDYGLDIEGCEDETTICADLDNWINNSTPGTDEYKSLVELKNEMCENKTFCDVIYIQLLQDVSPGGVYAKYSYEDASGNNESFNTDNTGSFWNNISNPRSLLEPGFESSSLAYYQKPISLSGNTEHYYDEFDRPVVFPISSFGQYLINKSTATKYDQNGNPNSSGKFISPKDFTLEAFIYFFKSSWAKSLLKYHPEYVKYEKCITDLQKSHEYDALMFNAETIQDAISLDLFDPFCGNSDPTLPKLTTVNIDPNYSAILKNSQNCYASSYLESDFYNLSSTNKGEFKSKLVLENIYREAVNQDATLWELADFFANLSISNGCQPNDEYWYFFRSFYANLKTQYYASVYNNIAIGSLSPYTSILPEYLRFTFDKSALADNLADPDLKDIVNDLGTANFDKNQSFDDLYEEVKDHCETNCERKFDFLKNELIQCIKGPTPEIVVDQLINELINICKNSCDEGLTKQFKEPIKVATMNGNKTSQEAFIWWSSQYGVQLDQLCNPYIISYFGIGSDKETNADGCLCDSSGQVWTAWNSFNQKTDPCVNDLFKQHFQNQFPSTTIEDPLEAYCYCRFNNEEKRGAIGVPAPNDPCYQFFNEMTYVSTGSNENDCNVSYSKAERWFALINYLYNNNYINDEGNTGSLNLLNGNLDNVFPNSNNTDWFMDPSIPNYQTNYNDGTFILQQIQSTNGEYISFGFRLNEQPFYNCVFGIREYRETLSNTGPYVCLGLCGYDIVWDYLGLTYFFKIYYVSADGVLHTFEISSDCFEGTTFNCPREIEPRHIETNLSCQDPCLSCWELSDLMFDFNSEMMTDYGISLDNPSYGPGDFIGIAPGNSIWPETRLEKETYFQLFMNYVARKSELNYTVAQLMDFWTTCDAFNFQNPHGYGVYTNYSGSYICPEIPKAEPCSTSYNLKQKLYINTRIRKYIEQKREEFYQNYLNHCKTAFIEIFKLNGKINTQHYTLYYYDRAGNLTQTVPPEGVDMIPNATNSTINNHALQTTYQYNAINQVVKQSTPDGGTTHFWYDVLGRVTISQNAKQADMTPKAYSYTLYDNLGRITEVGQVQTTASISTSSTQFSPNQLNSILANGTKSEITRTFYDHPENMGTALKNKYNTSFKSGQPAFNQNRVLAIQYIDNNSNGNQFYTFYSYDIHGNVKELVQYNPMVQHADFEIKSIQYEYELISGNVDLVKYQEDEKDAFYHTYLYDADNRITDAYTSKDNKRWEKQANYDYYLHGPLARTELGQINVQGIDYAYTIHGWIKSVNGKDLDPNADMGQDGSIGNPTAKDAAAYTLHYYHGDYSAIGSNSAIGNGPGLGLLTTNDLFNGNIKAMETVLPDAQVFANTKNIVSSSQGMAYQYDQLNRIVNAQSHLLQAGAWGNTTAYAANYSYDANGNISHLNRWATNGQMDNLAYNYKPGTNQLHYVTDAVAPSNYSNDIDNQGPVNYDYDQVGNLIRDDSENIMDIEWTVYGKIQKIVRGVANKPNLEFAYDPSGNRIMKKVIPNNGDPSTTTWYVRDASGNIMSTYTETSNTYTWQSAVIYGSSRLGVYNAEIELINYTQPATGQQVQITRGQINYELSNHLGNVLVTVTDRKIAKSSTGSIPDYFEADITTITDYYPFGMQMEERSWSGGSYRFGFQSHEKDDEVFGSTGSYLSFGDMGYDTRIGRRWRTDPYFNYYPDISPYAAFGNNPIYFKDLDGNILRDQDGNIIYTKDGNSFWVEAFGQRLQVQSVFIYTNEGKKVSVQMVTDVQDIATGNSVKDGTTKNTYICHGFSMTEGKFIPNSEHSVSNTLVLDKMGRSDLTPKEVKDNLATDFSKIQGGDILVFYDNQYNRETGEMEEGVVTHTAVWSESEGKYISKNGYNEIGMYSLDELKNIYGNNIGYFTPQEDKKVEVKGTSSPVYGTTEVSGEDVNKSLQE